jgi:hypothetical protein
MLGKRFEGGVDLSGGEWQKVALARAYMRDAQLLILDEPTAALDARAEYEVFLRFSELTKGRMAVLISHRFSNVVVLASLIPLAWYVSVLVDTNAGWGWTDPKYAVAWIGRSLAGWTAAAGAAALTAAAVWRPYRWTVFAPALVAVIALVTRRLYLIGSPWHYFLSYRVSARWFLAAVCLLQILALTLMVVPPAGKRAGSAHRLTE